MILEAREEDGSDIVKLTIDFTEDGPVPMSETVTLMSSELSTFVIKSLLDLEDRGMGFAALAGVLATEFFQGACQLSEAYENTLGVDKIQLFFEQTSSFFNKIQDGTLDAD